MSSQLGERGTQWLIRNMDKPEISVVHVDDEVYRGSCRQGALSGAYAQGTGPVGLEDGSTSNLWLQNKAGVIMHLKGKNSGVTLSLGRDEIFIEMSP